jgi:hypothetical protein
MKGYRSAMNQRPATPDELFEDMLYSPMDWPGKTTRLRRDSVQDVRQRAASPIPALTEFYHENSKLHPARIVELAASRVDPEEVREAFLRRKAAGSRRAAAIDTEWFGSVRPLLRAVARPARLPLFYALELRVSDGALLAQYEPLTDALVALKATSSADYASVAQGLHLFDSRSTPAAGLLFVVASFVRNEVLYGPRGYRRTLLEAGRLVEIILVEAERLGISVNPVLEFHDRAIDRFVEVDGLEEGTLLVIELAAAS